MSNRPSGPVTWPTPAIAPASKSGVYSMSAPLIGLRALSTTRPDR